MQNAFRTQLVRWYESNARELPWRSKPTPYRVWVSEIMLQQTRVEAVREHFKRFLKRFPTVRKVADASTEQVLEAWSGLGYYRRARMLHAAAKQIVQRHNGRFPATRADVLGLPGIGPYTAGAILSIAFDQPEPIVDGNVERVFARLTALDANVKTDGRNQISALSTEHVTAGAAEGFSPSVLNQALMELGATVCTPTNPRCGQCPVARHCAALASNEVARYPVLPKRAARTDITYRFVALRDSRARILMIRRAEGDASNLLPAGMWELPLSDADFGATIIGKPIQRKHSIMNYRVTLEMRQAKPAATIRASANMRWFTLEQARKAAIASATRKLLDALGD